MNANDLIAIVGLGAILPDAFDVPSFWKNLNENKVSIRNLPAGRWDPALFYDPDPAVPDKTYTKIGAFVEGYCLDPFSLGLVLPPRVLETLDPVQHWAIAASHQALSDYGWPAKALDGERTAVILGNSNAGEEHYNSTFRLRLPQYQAYLQAQPAFQALPANLRRELLAGVQNDVWQDFGLITEDTMPGELSNIIAGRVANLFNLTGPNFTTDAACASSLAALSAAVDALRARRCDLALTGGVDRSNGPESYIKFAKIGALSPDGSRPYAAGANGFVMGEGGAVFLLKRLADAERDDDKIYAVIRGVGASSDGKGKGITAPNPAGQQKAIERAWQAAGVNPAQVGYIEGHGTSTRVGDLAEVNSLQTVFGALGLSAGSVVLSSVKANIGHLKSAAGAAGLLKTVLALSRQKLPQTPAFEAPNPGINFGQIPFSVLREPREWPRPQGSWRYAGVSSFGFGGTNFHVVLEEYAPGIAGSEQVQIAVPALAQTAPPRVSEAAAPALVSVTLAQPAVTQNEASVRDFVLTMVAEKTGYPPEMLDLELDLEADLGVDTVKQAELFAALREHYGIPRKDELILADYNTLSKVIRFVLEEAPASPPDASPRNAAAPAPASAQAASAVPAAEAITPAFPIEKSAPSEPSQAQPELKPYQGFYFAAADDPQALLARVQADLDGFQAGRLPASLLPRPDQLARPERLAIDYADRAELPKKLERVLSALQAETPAVAKALQAHGIYRGSGQPGKVAFLFPGQGSQYVNMLKDLFEDEPLVRETFAEADAAMTPILGRPLTSFIYADGDETALKTAEDELKKTAVTQPAMLAANVAIMRVMQKFGLRPDYLIGHSLGEYAALVAAGVLSFADALKIVSARGRAMTSIDAPDPGAMAAVSAPIERVQALLKELSGYIVIANINSPVQCVLGGETAAIEAAVEAFKAQGLQAVRIPVSHAFHTRIVAPASTHLREEIAVHPIGKMQVPVVANVTGELYPESRDEILDMLATQVAAPVQFVQSMQTLYARGARVYIECGPKRVLSALAADNLKEYTDVTVIPTNHPRKGGKASFNEALCAMAAAGLPHAAVPQPAASPAMGLSPAESARSHSALPAVDERGFSPITGSVVVSGAGLGLPGKHQAVFDDGNIQAILNGEMRIEALSDAIKQDILEKRITRLVKSQAGAVMEKLTDPQQALQYAGQGGHFDLAEDFGLPANRVEALDISSQLAIAAGIEALRDAGIPLVMAYKTTSVGSQLPDRWKLPASLQDETGVIFGSAFPGLNRVMEEQERYLQARLQESQLADLDATIELTRSLNLPDAQILLDALQARRAELAAQAESKPYGFDRRFLFRILSMGHSQFADYIGARGPNAHVNAACATTTHAVSLAEDWIRSGRCRRVIVIAGDDVTNPQTMDWVGSSLLASGAASSEADLRLAAIPFDRRRNGMIMGMGAVGIVLESQDAVRERGMSGIAELLASYTANSAFHGTRLDLAHVSQGMDDLLTTAERRFGFNRAQIAGDTLFVSHETYTPARGGSASAEIHALRHAFGPQADQVLIANTKGFTGHSMGVGIEDVVAIKALQTGIVPPIANLDADFEPDPELGTLKLSRGGHYNPQYALRLGAGFGSQIAFTLMRRLQGAEARLDSPVYQDWLDRVTGYARAATEVVKRTLRVPDQGIPLNTPAASTWVYGQVPQGWASEMVPQANSETITAPVQLPNATQDSPGETPPASTGAPSLSVPSPMPAPPAGAEDARAVLLAMVSEKTGYPAEMLDLNLDLEADLGIDTVKQAELFAGIREHYAIPRQENLVLSDYNTLAKVLNFIETNRGNQAAAESAAGPAEPAVLALPAPSNELLTPAAAAETQASVPWHAPQPVPGSADEAAIQAYLLQAVSEKTGYPAEMLDLNLDLEADLGIDTVKQAELFAAVREHYAIPRQENLILSDYNTLAKVIGFVQEGLRAQAKAMEAQAETAQAQADAQTTTAVPQPADPGSVMQESTADDPSVTQVLIPRQPIPVLLPKAQLYLPALTELKGKKVGILGGGKARQNALLKALEAEEARAVLLDPAAFQTQLADLDGLYFLQGMQAAPAEPQAWQDWADALLETLYTIATLLPKEAFILAATAMGGYQAVMHPSRPDSGLISGFFKALRRERPAQLIKTIDFEPQVKPPALARAFLAETRHDGVNVEIGYHAGLRYGLDLHEQPLPDHPIAPLAADSVVLITGGTAGIVAPIARDLAAHAPGTYYLLGRTPLLPADDPELRLLAEDSLALKTQLAERLQAVGQKATPVAIEAALSRLQKAAGMHILLADLTARGAKAHYLVCDLNDPASLNQALARVRAQSGRVDLVIHAAGLEISRKIENKTADELKQVVAAKAHGLQALQTSLSQHQLQPNRWVFFSSVAGRFGNAGQTDYAAANDWLCKQAYALSASGAQAIAIDWSAWAEVGMATRGSIPRIMRMAGVELLQPHAAAPLVRGLLEAGATGEWLVAGSMGKLAPDNAGQGGVDLLRADAELHRQNPTHAMFSHISAFSSDGGLKLSAELDPSQEAYLHDHAINGIPVLPGVVGIEGFARAAQHVAGVLASARGFKVQRVDDVQFLAPLKFYRNAPRKIEWTAKGFASEDGIRVEAALESDWLRANGENNHTLHFQGAVYLSEYARPQREIRRSKAWNAAEGISAEEIYKLYFHGPAFQVLAGAQLSGKNIVGRFNPALAHQPGSNMAATYPLLLELCFQTAGLFEIGKMGSMGLPRAVESIRLYSQRMNGLPVFALVTPRENPGGLSFDATVVDGDGNVFLEMARYQTSALPYALQPELLAPIQSHFQG